MQLCAWYVEKGNPRAKEAKRRVELQEQVERWSAVYNELVYFNPLGRLQKEKGEGRQEWEGEGLQKHTLLSSVLLRAFPEKKYPKTYIVFPLKLYHWNWRTWLYSNFCLKKTSKRFSSQGLWPSLLNEKHTFWAISNTK